MPPLNTIIEDDISEYEDQGRRNREWNGSPIARQSMESCSPVPSLTSSISSYYKTQRRSRDFDDLYDVSDCDSDQEHDQNEMPSVVVRPPSTYSGSTKRDSFRSTGSSDLSLVIPSPSHWPTIQKLQKNSPVPPTPPPKIAISPAVLSLLTHSPLASTAPPSLDGSLTSDQIACSTAPPTPEMRCHPIHEQQWDRVRVSEYLYTDNQTDLSSGARTPDVEIRFEESNQWDTEAIFEADTTNQQSCFSPEYTVPESPILRPVNDDGDEATEIKLPPGAMDTLRHLSREPTSEPASAVEGTMNEEMQEIPRGTARPHSAEMTPASAVSIYSLSQLSIPSPGGFFSSLGATARHTWYAFGSYPTSAVPLSSTTAERFYDVPWQSGPQATVERIVEIEEHETEGPSTARQAPSTARQASFSGHLSDELKDRDSIELGTEAQEIDLVKPVQDFDEEYEKEIWHVAESSLDRTSVWLAAQTSYMSALRETNPINSATPQLGLDSRRASKHFREASLDSPMKKAVKFLDIIPGRDINSKSSSSPRADPLFYQAFQHIANATSSTDSFIHRQTRCDAIQASRVSLTQNHVDQLLGRYHIIDADRPSPPRPISMMPGKGLMDDAEQTTEQRVIARIEKERQALEQVNTAMWIVEASKYLCGGRLLNSPVVGVLVRARPLDLKPGIGVQRVRVLDLGGQAKCDWAWHCAREYPNVKVYTATDDQHSMMSSLRGPSNHRLLSVTKLWELPFPDNHFDAISARSLFKFLKNEKPLGETVDEYDICLRECLRCLKPGGFLEFFVLDAEIVHSGPRGTAVSVEFGFNLKARGYDPAPTKSWLGRVRRVGLVDIKRAWMFLPMGTIQQDAYVPPETPPPNIMRHDARLTEAVQGPVGSTADAANISGLVGSWAWEQWMLRLQTEMGRENLLEGVSAALEEGKSTGAGWRCLSGWARKPMQ
ncbi:hypothetical protein MMC24_007018 [Lignoscripta atroalba]|nr:hypothetical protein [Lignoscripta atroalba]